MSPEIRTFAPDDREAQTLWSELYEQSPQRSAFATLDYLRAVAAAAGRPLELRIALEGGRPVAGTGLLWRRRGPFREVLVPPFTPYSALLLATSDDEAAVHGRRSVLELLLAHLERHYDRVRLHLHPSVIDVRAAQWRGWTVRPFFTYVLDARDPAGERRWSSSTRRRFERSRAAYEVAVTSSRAADVARCCRMSYERQGRRLPVAPQALEHLVATLAAAGHADVLTATLMATTPGADAPEGALALLRDDRSAYYWAVGSLPGDAMTVLLGSAAAHARSLGLCEFDLVGANTPSIAEFKRRFGPELRPYYALTFERRRVLRILSALRG